jgi:hypothetical protein
LDIDQLNTIYDQLDSVSCEEMLGQWRGMCFNTGHPGEKILGTIGWAGKEFRSVNDVSPIMCADKNGVLSPSAIMGDTSLRMVGFRGHVTATMVCDQHPIFDHFKRIDDDTMLGVMDAKSEDLPLYFLLQRAK